MKKDIVPVVIIGGGYRFFTKVREVEDMWREVMGDDFITVLRQSRIFYRNKFYDYPLRIFNAISGANDTASLIEEFQYPRLGPGMMRKPC